MFVDDGWFSGTVRPLRRRTALANNGQGRVAKEGDDLSFAQRSCKWPRLGNVHGA